MTKTTTKKPKFSAGKKVLAYSRSSGPALGRVVGIQQRVNGAWVQVNLAAPRKTPNVRSFRPANLQLA